MKSIKYWEAGYGSKWSGMSDREIFTAFTDAHKNDMFIRREIMPFRWVQHKTIGYNMRINLFD